MRKRKIIIYVILIVFLLFFAISCDKKQKQNEEPNQEINGNAELIGNKDEKLYSDYIYFEIVNLDIECLDIEGNNLNVAEIKILKNYNDYLNIETDYSKYINKNKNENLLIAFSDTYYKYLSVGDLFIYKLDDIVKTNNQKPTEIFTTVNNEYTLFPVVDGENLILNYTSNLSVSEEKDFKMETIIIERFFYYGTDIDNHFIEYDYSISYHEGTPLILNDKRAFNRFENVLKSLMNESKEEFYKLKFSELYSEFYVIEYENIIDNYLENIGGI